MSRWQFVTLVLPADTPLGVPAGRWRRLATGKIEATYTPDELALAILGNDAAGGKESPPPLTYESRDFFQEDVT